MVIILKYLFFIFLQAITWKEDFQKERDDRQKAAGRIDDERAEIHLRNQELKEELHMCYERIHQFESEHKTLHDDIKIHRDEIKTYQQVMTEFDKMQHELVQHQDQLANMEQLFQSQQQQHKDQLKQADQQLQQCKAQLEQANRLHRTQLEEVHRQQRQINVQLDETITNNEKLHDDVLAKTQQVKQYKKQVDGLKTELAKYKSQAATMSHQQQDKEEVGCIPWVWTGQGGICGIL